jgi:outer membrane lipoprotein-sorting protein
VSTRVWAVLLIMIPILGSIHQQEAFPDDQAAAIIDGIRTRYGNDQGLSALYTREAVSKTMATLGITERRDIAEGRLYFKPPCSLRLEQKSPQEELLLTNGETLWWYIPEKQEAYKYPADSFGKELRLLGDVLQGLKDARTNFAISYTESLEGATYRLMLRPEPPWKDIDHLELIIGKDDFVIKQLDIVNTIGGLTRFMFSDMKEGLPSQEDLFSISIPPGTRLIME